MAAAAAYVPAKQLAQLFEAAAPEVATNLPVGQLLHAVAPEDAW